MLTLTNRHAERMTAAELAAKPNVPGWLRHRLALLAPATVVDSTWVQGPTRRECLDFSICTDPTIAPRAERRTDPWTGD